MLGATARTKYATRLGDAFVVARVLLSRDGARATGGRIVRRRDGRRTLSSSSSSLDDDDDEKVARRRRVGRLGIGGTRKANADPQRYADIVETALRSGVSTFESVSGGEESLARAYTLARMNMTSDRPNAADATLTARFGYRSEHHPGNGNGDGNGNDGDRFPNDVSLVNDIGELARGEGGGGGKGASTTTERVFHNIGPEYLERCLEDHPLVKIRRGEWSAGDDGAEDTNLVLMAHNPEAQGSDIFSTTTAPPPLDEVRALVRERLVDSFRGLEGACSDGSISSYGVCSNGLSLPSDHPLHLSWRDVVDAACEAANAVHGEPTVPKLSTLQLPANLLETHGVRVASDVHSFFASAARDHHDGDARLPSAVDVYVSRPLTCYPDQGTGAGHPFKLVDYEVTLGMEDSSPVKSWTHRIESVPQYGPALGLALRHFDAEEILDAQKERDLTVEERETLDGCRLLRSMLRDLDRGLDSVRSFDAYEDELYTKVVPVVHDTFEEMDERSAAVLQAFFAAHASAVRHAIARRTRSFLREGGDGVPPYDVPDHSTLQDFALRWLLAKENCATKVVVSCLEPNHVRDAVDAAAAAR